MRRGLPKPLALTELSVCQNQDASYYYKLLKEKNYIFARDSPEQVSFENLVLNLSVLRIRGPQFHWSKFTFSHRLTELHLEEILLGYHDLPHLIGALSSASELRVLKIISIKTFHSAVIGAPPTHAKIHLPNLQDFLVDDVFFNTLDCLLSSIASRSHHLTLLLTDICRYVNLPGIDTDTGLEDISWGALPELLGKVGVKDLLVYGDIDDPWMSSSELGDLIKSVAPTLETLWMDSWEFDTAHCSSLAYPSLSDGSSSPHLINLHVTRSRIRDAEAFEDMVISHSESIQRMALGAATRDSTRDPIEWVPCKGHGPLELVLKHSVSDFQLVDYNFDPPEFKQVPWQLW
ncbi:hypothetical protein FRC11_007897 [Ceratobasidium sp. 423]|nr:hypothetical protein FRC11_007897 [Ceratobasidium sp. 423]